MARCILIDNNNKIELDSKLNLQERIDFCQHVIDTYPEYFQYTLPRNATDPNIAGYKVQQRLEEMANYILRGAGCNREANILSEYKEKKISFTEVQMSDLEGRFDYNNDD